MNEIRPSYYKDKQYYFTGDLGYFQISEPRNWNEDEKEFKRSEKVHGVFTNLSNNLQFYKGDATNDGGYDYLKQTYDIYGINAQVLLVKKEIIDGKWVDSYRGYLDFSTYSRLSNLIEIKFNESGLYEKIKARQSEDLEINRSETMDGDALEQLNQNRVSFESREILIINELNRRFNDTYLKVPSGTDNYIEVDKDYTNLAFRHDKLGLYEAICVPLVMSPETDGNVQTIYETDIKENNSLYANEDNPAVMFYAEAVNDKKLIIDIDFDSEYIAGYNGDFNHFRLDLVIYENGANLDYKDKHSLIDKEHLYFGDKFSFKDTIEYEIKSGQSLALAVHSSSLAERTHKLKINRSDVVITDPTYFENSDSEFVLPHEALDRMLHIITNKENTLKSTALGRIDLGYEVDGDSAYVGITNGFWVEVLEIEQRTTLRT